MVASTSTYPPLIYFTTSIAMDRETKTPHMITQMRIKRFILFFILNLFLSLLTYRSTFCSINKSTIKQYFYPLMVLSYQISQCNTIDVRVKSIWPYDTYGFLRISCSRNPKNIRNPLIFLWKMATFSCFAGPKVMYFHVNMKNMTFWPWYHNIDVM